MPIADCQLKNAEGSRPSIPIGNRQLTIGNLHSQQSPAGAIKRQPGEVHLPIRG